MRERGGKKKASLLFLETATIRRENFPGFPRILHQDAARCVWRVACGRIDGDGSTMICAIIYPHLHFSLFPPKQSLPCIPMQCVASLFSDRIIAISCASPVIHTGQQPREEKKGSARGFCSGNVYGKGPRLFREAKKQFYVYSICSRSGSLGAVGPAVRMSCMYNSRWAASSVHHHPSGPSQRPAGFAFSSLCFVVSPKLSGCQQLKGSDRQRAFQDLAAAHADQSPTPYVWCGRTIGTNSRISSVTASIR